ncbi:IS110 family transposase [Streptomyces sp. NPDC051896]|uniref:IS110 family transposase n=1 Tax=Streptomyces sp. NPDC051896 TaxID=3155416 RepID=UPI0034370858
MTDQTAVVGGVDTHTDFHQAAVIDSIGRHLATQAFPTTPDGYRRLLDWFCSHGDVIAVGVEGTGAYGCELARYLRQNQITVIEVDRPDRRARRASGKSDPIDAFAAATAVLTGRAGGTPKARDGIVEAVRTLRVVRRSAVKARTQTINQIRTLIITAPGEMREQLRALTPAELIKHLARTRPGTQTSDPACAVKVALRRLARRHQYLTAEIDDADTELEALMGQAAPELIALPGVGIETAAQLLITAGDNPERLTSEASFAHLCAVAPVPASSGRTNRHRLNRGGDRRANHALHMIALVRMRYDQRTQAYVTRRTAEGMSKKDILRCLKRFIAREVYKHLTRQHTPAKPLIQAA